MDTAGQIELEIPAVVTPDGQVHAGYWTNEDGEPSTDISLLKSRFSVETATKIVTVKATIDLDEVFSGHLVEGSVDGKEG